MAKINVLHMVEDLKIGGLEKIILLIVLGLDKAKYNVEVWCLSKGGKIADELIKNGIRVNILGIDNYYNPLKIIKLARLIRKDHAHIIHTHGYFASTFGRLAAVLAGVPAIITHVHSTYYGYTKRNIFIERVLSYFTGRIICVSRAVRDFVVEYERIPDTKTVLIYNAAQPPESDETSTDLGDRGVSIGFEKQNIVIIVVASLTANKGHKVLFDALSLLSDKNSNIRLMIVGDGPQRDNLEAYAVKLEISSLIRFMGQKNKVYPLLKIAHLCVLPSVEREGLGIALIEAMAAGLPLIGSNLGGIPEVIIDAVNGILVAPGDPYELASAIETITCDKAMMKKMGQMGKKIYAEKFTVKKMIQNIESLYDSLIDGVPR